MLSKSISHENYIVKTVFQFEIGKITSVQNGKNQRSSNSLTRQSNSKIAHYEKSTECQWSPLSWKYPIKTNKTCFTNTFTTLNSWGPIHSWRNQFQTSSPNFKCSMIRESALSPPIRQGIRSVGGQFTLCLDKKKHLKHIKTSGTLSMMWAVLDLS